MVSAFHHPCTPATTERAFTVHSFFQLASIFFLLLLIIEKNWIQPDLEVTQSAVEPGALTDPRRSLES